MTGWQVAVADKVDAELLDALFEDRVAAVRIPNFISRQAAEAAVQAVEAHGFDYYQDVEPPIGRIGITQYEHRLEGMGAYFATAAAADRRRRAVLGADGDLLQKVLGHVGTAWNHPVGTACNADGAEYFAGLVRIINEALLHCDWAPHDAPGWSIASVTGQITWNIYCNLAAEGGTTVVYRRGWDASAEEFAVDGSYGYDPRLVEGVPSVRIEPRQGDLTFFNSRNFHRVEASSPDARRISVSSFIGRMPSGDLIAWS
ncbi:2OG-Fe(II)-dependent halogenase WelO5 family protein [Actinoplanes derwentensis]|uniref:2OG-Fe(II) oxygenase superfamily protein n=1 Tax=Actinoplanes derwentensis TaxID=113562 RepID=A0A1H2DCN3_9ACTN|nr:2OG-Fe(II) oxygenase [Actinoplanes derwentensis]GID89554.1 hypothetical protein Ade03nite_84780 [Actinoplanes derwentensis]SDT80505.1 2OG-Fe(II) oxygenase superfamily protein [Actinoplanes derwentensis]